MTQSKARVSSVTVRGRTPLAQVARPERAETIETPPEGQTPAPAAK